MEIQPTRNSSSPSWPSGSVGRQVLTCPTKKASDTGFGPDKTFRDALHPILNPLENRRRTDPESRALPHIGREQTGKGEGGAGPALRLPPSGPLRHGDCDDGEAIDASEVGGVAGIYR